MNDFGNNMSRYTIKGKLVVGSFLAAIVAGIAAGITDKGEEVYRGTLEGYSIVYEEGRFSMDNWLMDNRGINRMTLQKGDTFYTFEDQIEGDTIYTFEDRMDNYFERDILEKVVVSDGNSSITYWNPFNKDTGKNVIDASTFQGQYTQEIFRKANSLYNRFRKEIRDELRRRYEAEQKSVVDAFPK